MAILGPEQLPVILKVDSNPLKFHALSQLGHPVVLVELIESQMEQVLRSTGNFISHYFPLEERFAFFMTQPLQAEYPIPEDAYWIRNVSWDPSTTRIDDIFGAESFLFCVDEEFQVLDKDGSLQCVGDWKSHWKAKTPYGHKKLKIKNHQIEKKIPKLEIDYGYGKIKATINHPIMIDGNKWREFKELKIGDQLSGVDNMYDIQNIDKYDGDQAISIRALKAGVYYGCHTGEPVLIH